SFDFHIQIFFEFERSRPGVLGEIIVNLSRSARDSDRFRRVRDFETAPWVCQNLPRRNDLWVAVLILDKERIAEVIGRKLLAGPVLEFFPASVVHLPFEDRETTIARSVSVSTWQNLIHNFGEANPV